MIIFEKNGSKQSKISIEEEKSFNEKLASLPALPNDPCQNIPFKFP